MIRTLIEILFVGFSELTHKKFNQDFQFKHFGLTLEY